MKHSFLPGVALAACLVSPVSAEIVPSETGGFASSNSAVVAADRAAVWAMLVKPQHWWTHSWSDDSANLTLNPVAGGCFCEVVPNAGGGAPGSAEHARVVMSLPQSTLRMVGALGPLQAEGLVGTLTVTLTDFEQGTRITWDYVVGGQGRIPPAGLADVVDSVQLEFLMALVAAIEEAG